MTVRTRAGICRTRRVGGDGYRSATRAVETESVELFSVSQVGAYAYLQSWTLRDDGAIEPVIGHLKGEHRMDRNYLKGRDGDRTNAVLAAAGYNFSLLIRWFETLLRALIQALLRASLRPQNP